MIIQHLEQKAGTGEPYTRDEHMKLVAHIAEIELGYQRLMEMREAELLRCRVRRVAA